MDFNVCSTMTRLCHSSALTIPQRISCAFAIPCNRHRFCCTFPFRDHRCISGHVTKNMQRKTRAFPEKEGGLAQAHCFTVVQNSEEEAELTSSSMAIAMAIRRASASPVEFVQRMEKVARGVFSCPSADFRTLCNEQLALCGNLVGEDILLSVYIRPAESYGTDQLELRRAACYPGQDLSEPDDTLALIGTFGTQKGLRSVEIALVERPAEEFPEHNAMVLPLVKDLFLVGLLVAIRPPAKDVEPSSLPAGMKSENDAYNALFNLFTAEQRSEAVKIAHSLALAYVMDQGTCMVLYLHPLPTMVLEQVGEQVEGAPPTFESRQFAAILVHWSIFEEVHSYAPMENGEKCHFQAMGLSAIKKLHNCRFLGAECYSKLDA